MLVIHYFSDINDCLPNPCMNEGTCSDRIDGYSCSCVAGYTGQNCEISMHNLNTFILRPVLWAISFVRHNDK